MLQHINFINLILSKLSFPQNKFKHSCYKCNQAMEIAIQLILESLKPSYFFILQKMLLKTLQSLKSSKTVGLTTFSNLIKESFIPSSSVDYSNDQKTCTKYNVPNISTTFLGMRLGYSFCTFSNRNTNKQEINQNNLNQTSSLVGMTDKLKNSILQTSITSMQRINKCVQDEVHKQMQKFKKALKMSAKTQQQQIKLVSQQRERIQQNLRGNQDLMKFLEQNENHRAMIMVRLSILWNQNYEELSIDDVVYIVSELKNCKQLKNNELKPIALVFLAVQAFKKCIKSPRINKNMVCSTKTITENITYMKECFQGQMKMRSNLEKSQNLLSSLLNGIEKSSNRYCFMKFQSQLHYLTAQIFKSFYEPDLYKDRSICLLANPPRVVFDEPFHQEYDRFIEMAILVLFDKRLKKQAKSHKLQHVKHLFQKIKLYEEGKLQESYQKHEASLLSIDKLRKKVQKMDNRVNLIQWIQNFLSKNQGK